MAFGDSAVKAEPNANARLLASSVTGSETT